MGQPYYLIDFENVQPKALDRLRPGEARVKVFLGQQQTRLMLDVVQALQPFGSDAEYVQITGSGPDAVDFHIAYYVGRIAALEPGASFCIVSKDKGFDPLVRHLTGRGIACRRVPEIPATARPDAVASPAKAATKVAAKKTASRNVAAKKAAAKNGVVTVLPATSVAPAGKAPTTATRAQVVITCLKKSTKPGKVSGLRKSIQSWLKPELVDEGTIDAVMQSLRASRKITVDGEKVTYSLG